MDLFRAIPRPLGQFLAVVLIWPLWFLLGLIESIWQGSGATIQKHISDGLAAIPSEGWGAIAAIVVAGHWSRSKDKQTQAKASEILVEAAKITGRNQVDDPD